MNDKWLDVLYKRREELSYMLIEAEIPERIAIEQELELIEFQIESLEGSYA